MFTIKYGWDFIKQLKPMGYTAELTREANCFFVCLFICLFCFVFVFFMSLVVTEHKLFGAIRNKFGNLEVYKCKRNVLKLEQECSCQGS